MKRTSLPYYNQYTILTQFGIKLEKKSKTSFIKKMLEYLNLKNLMQLSQNLPSFKPLIPTHKRISEPQTSDLILVASLIHTELFHQLTTVTTYRLK